jgi:RND superfamily putative drug exporter
LLARALRSLVLPLKAVVLNALSLGCALGLIVWVFQEGHGSNAIWGYHATESIVAWIPLMIFAFLFGISMDYEVFMLSRIREAYDDTGDTSEAVGIGLTHTGKLVTSAAAILMCTFLVLSTQPGPDFKEFAIGLGAGIIIDATLIRALLVPSIIDLLGRANWWMPAWANKILLVREEQSPAKA